MIGPLLRDVPPLSLSCTMCRRARQQKCECCIVILLLCGSKQRTTIKAFRAGGSVWGRNSLQGELWDLSLSRPFTCTKTYITLQERENPENNNKASLIYNIAVVTLHLLFQLSIPFYLFRNTLNNKNVYISFWLIKFHLILHASSSTRLRRSGVALPPHRGIPGPPRSPEVRQQPAEGRLHPAHRQQDHLLRTVLLRLRRSKRLREL